MQDALRPTGYFFLLFPAWESALPAADFEAALVRPSRNTPEAALAACGDVVLFGALVCERALPAALRDLAPVEPLVSVFDAFDAALPPVVSPLAIATSELGWAKLRRPCSGPCAGQNLGCLS